MWRQDATQCITTVYWKFNGAYPIMYGSRIELLKTDQTLAQKMLIFLSSSFSLFVSFFLSWVNDFVCVTKHVIEIDARENCVFKDALYWYNYMKGNNNKNSNITAKKYLWYYDIKETKYGYGQNKEAYQNDHIKTDYFCD